MGSEWQQIQLGKVCLKVGSGATPRGGKDAYRGGNTALIRSQNIYNDRFNREGLAYINDSQAHELRNVVVQKNDVLLNITGDSVARCCQVDPDILPARVNQHVAIIRTQPDVLDARFLRYILISPSIQDHLLALASAGATRNALTKAMIESLSIKAPLINEQRAIAHILGTLDDKIELNRKQNETLEAMARALFKAWFVDFEPVRAKLEGRWQRGQSLPGLPGHLYDVFPDRLVESELGDVPEGWEITKVEAVLKRLSTKVRYTKDQVSSYGRTPVFEQGASIVLGFHDGDAFYQASADDPAFVFGDHTCITKLSCQPFDISQNVIPLRGQGRPTMWVYYAINEKQKFEEYRRHWMELITKDLIVAPNQICLEFSKRATIFYIQMEQSEREFRSLAQLRDTLLPKLISGELRIPDAEAFLKERGL